MQSPIALLPTELLVELFAQLAVHEPLAPLVLSRVCHVWQEIVIISPRIWQFITLDENRCSILSLRTHAELWLSRSAPLPIDIEISLISGDSMLPILSPLLPELGRWRKLAIRGLQDGDVGIPELDWEDPSTQLQMTNVELHLFDADASHNQIEITSLFTTLWLSSLPHASLLTSLPFTTLMINETQLGKPQNPAKLLDFLAACPNLAYFKYTGLRLDHDYHEASLPVADLPNLRTLQLSNTCSARSILSYLHAPTLRHLILKHLNVEYQLHCDYDEDGDSEDEAHDYSRSPWSDHATGMGLRRLITRSNPPIETLEMEYADMRTKDFRWCFNKLKTLKKFRIVESDMSDKVIELFKPFRKHAQNRDGVKECPPQLRLPALEELKLLNCPRFSGDAAVDALTSRVNFPDRTLIQVLVVGCQNVTPSHCLSLRELGSHFET